MFGPRFQHLAAFRMSFWNKQIESEDGGFGDQEALLGRPFRMPNDQILLMFAHFR
jgi:hypothetical protein